MRFEITADGTVAAAEVVTSSGYPELDEAALEASRSATFHPATDNGVNVTGTVQLSFEFRLRN